MVFLNGIIMIFITQEVRSQSFKMIGVEGSFGDATYILSFNYLCMAVDPITMFSRRLNIINSCLTIENFRNKLYCFTCT